MRIKMLQTAAGPFGTYLRDSEANVPDSLGKVWVDEGFATPIGGYETTAAPQMAERETRSLRDINGIGPATAKRLRAAGIETTADLVAASADEVARAAGTNLATVAEWKAQC